MSFEIAFVQYAVFEPGTRNTGTAIAGKNIANPIAMISASVDMLHFLGHKTYGDAISNAIRKTICEDKILTRGNVGLPFEQPMSVDCIAKSF